MRSAYSKTKRAELEQRLSESRQLIVCLQETWLDDSVSSLCISGYKPISRRDREDCYGGVFICVREDVEFVVPLCVGVDAEIQLCTIHAACGPLLLCNWYRPPGASEAAIIEFQFVLEQHVPEHVGVVVVGDLNIHHHAWLGFSSGRCTREGRHVKSICDDCCLSQLVREPTRQENLLDVVFTDMPAMCSVKVLPPIADHCVVSAVFDIHTMATAPIQRSVWHWKSARWNDLRRALQDCNWDSVFASEDPNEIAERITEMILSQAHKHIKFNAAILQKRSHPWLTKRAQEAIRIKCEAYGSVSFTAAARACQDIVAEEFKTYQRKLREQLASLPRGSKRWWRVNRELLDKKASLSSISPLKASDGRWLLDPIDKANELANTFMNKSKLPPAVPQQDFAAPAVEMSGFILIRARVAKRALKMINEDKATGPDSLPGKILKMCHAELAGPLARFSRLLVLRGVWPECWRNHWVCPLHKRGAVSNSSNYRGVHLTSILSKTVERIIGSVFLPFLDATGAYGHNQWAFRKEHSCKDLVTAKVASWIWAAQRKCKQDSRIFELHQRSVRQSGS